MTTLELAKKYFELSNAGDLASIEVLFLENSTYSSSQGLFFGRCDIMNMMRPFFAQYRSLCWTIQGARELTTHIAEIDFSFLGEDSEGLEVRRQGVERIVVHSEKIQHIEVRVN